MKAIKNTPMRAFTLSHIHNMKAMFETQNLKIKE
jgi:hypothetical protein